MQESFAEEHRSSLFFQILLKSIYFAPRERSPVNLEIRIVPSLEGASAFCLSARSSPGARDLPESAVPARAARRDVRGRAPLEPFLNATTSTAVAQRPFIDSHVL